VIFFCSVISCAVTGRQCYRSGGFLPAISHTDRGDQPQLLLDFVRTFYLFEIS
jgi:hypothetical protein